MTTATMTSNNKGRNETIGTDETHDLISSEKVDGTTVYDSKGEKLGSIKQVMIGKRDGRVRYAVMSFGGLFGMGERYHPLPWDTLDYDEDKGGYVVNLTREKLEGGPTYQRDEEPKYDRDYSNRVYGYYGSTW